jgi:hypothetical protein
LQYRQRLGIKDEAESRRFVQPKPLKLKNRD